MTDTYSSQPSTILRREVVVLIDNSKDAVSGLKSPESDFRGSSFKQTEVDPQEPRPEFPTLNQDQSVITTLKKRVQQLESRVSKLEVQSQRQTVGQKFEFIQKKKIRRTFGQLNRSHYCQHKGCQKVYGSETSLKNHKKLKHRT